jgi:two-component sensor histidine kinase
MWFGTSEGLVSFDGISFKKYVNDRYAIAYTNVKFDKYGRVWCSNFGGQLFYLDQDSLKLAVNWSTNGDFITDYFVNNLPEIIIIGSGNVEISKYHLGTNHKEVVYKANHQKLFSLPFNEQLQLAIHENVKDKDTGLLKVFKPETFPEENRVENIYNINVPSGKYSLFGDSNHLYLNVFTESGHISQLLTNNEVSTIASAIDLSTYTFNAIDFIDDKIWILSKKGVQIFDDQGNEYIRQGLSGISASCLFKDHEDNIWVGSLNRGISIVPNLTFNSLKVSQNSIAHSTYDEEGNLYILDDQGVLFSSVPPYKEVVRLNESQRLEPAPLFFDESQNRLYISSLTTYYDPVTNEIVSKKKSNSSFEALFKNAAYIGEGFFVSTLYTKAYIYNDSGSQNSPPLKFQEKEDLIRRYRSKHIQATEDLSGLYIDYIDGLYYYDRFENPKRVLLEQREIQTAAFQKDVSKVNRVWVATKSQELLAVEQGEIVELINLPVIARKIAITDQNIFIASLNGIYRLNRSTKELEIIDETDGWMKGRITSLFVQDNYCVVVGDQFIQRFPVTYSSQNTVKPEVYIKTMTVGDRSVQFLTENILPPGSNFITFVFRSLSVRSQKDLIYQYRLSSESNEWISTPFDNPEARFFNLDVGKYIFEVRACNGSGLCSEIQSVSFFIEAPFYRQWWFYLVIVVSVVLIVFFILRYYYRNKEKQEQMKSNYQRLRKETYKSRIAAIRSQMNPHFMFNALNTIQEFILTNQQDIASEYLADFADLMRMYLNQSKEENVSISEEKETLNIYLRLENLRFNGDLAYAIEVDDRINKDGTFIPVMLLQPYVENSIKHGLLHKRGKKKLEINFIQKGDHILCVIEDNGVGREASTRINASKSIGHKSFATGANNHRIDLINQSREKQIRVDIIDLYQDGEPSGTRVEIYIR